MINRARTGLDGPSVRDVAARGFAEGIGAAPFTTDLGGAFSVCNLQPRSRFTPIARPGPARPVPVRERLVRFPQAIV